MKASDGSTQIKFLCWFFNLDPGSLIQRIQKNRIKEPWVPKKTEKRCIESKFFVVEIDFVEEPKTRIFYAFLEIYSLIQPIFYRKAEVIHA